MAASLSTWDCKTLQPASVVLIFGTKTSGKSCMLRHVLSGIKSVFIAVAFVGNLATRRVLRRYIPDRFIKNGMTGLEDVLRTQHQMAYRVQENPDLELRHTALILDDVADTAALESPPMKYLIHNGRHIGLVTVLATAVVPLWTHEIAVDVDVVLLFPTPDPEHRQRIVASFLLPCLHGPDGATTLNALFSGLEPWEALVFDRRAFEAGSPSVFKCAAPYPEAEDACPLGAPSCWA